MNRFLPSREPIDSFGGGGFRFANMSHQGSILILPSGMRAWPVDGLSECTASDLENIIVERAEFDMLLIGSGSALQQLPQPARESLAKNQIQFEVMSTSAAIHIYNIALAEGRRVAAALISVANATR